MSSLLERFAAVLSELDRTPSVSVSRRVVEPSTRVAEGEPMSRERESARSVGLLLDDALCATYEDIAQVDITWSVDGAVHGSLCIPDYFDLEDAYVLPEEHGVTGEAAELLTELHLIECLDAGHWTAFRTPGFAREDVTAERMEIWTRIPAANGRGDLDLPLAVDWNGYVERMLLARGAEQFALTLVPDAAVPREQGETFAYFLRRFCDAASRFSDPALAELVAQSRARCARHSQSPTRPR